MLSPYLTMALEITGPVGMGASIIGAFFVAESGLLSYIYGAFRSAFMKAISFLTRMASPVYARLESESDRKNYLETNEKVTELLLSVEKDPLFMLMKEGQWDTVEEMARSLQSYAEVIDYMQKALVADCNVCMYYAIRKLRNSADAFGPPTVTESEEIIKCTNSIVLGAGFLSALLQIPHFADAGYKVLLGLAAQEDLEHFSEFFFTLARYRQGEAAHTIGEAQKAGFWISKKQLLSCVFFRLLNYNFVEDCDMTTTGNSAELDDIFLKALDTTVAKSRIIAKKDKLDNEVQRTSQVAMVDSLVSIIRKNLNRIIDHQLVNLFDLLLQYGTENDKKTISSSIYDKCTNPRFYARVLGSLKPDGTNLKVPNDSRLKAVHAVYSNCQDEPTAYDIFQFDKNVEVDTDKILGPYSSSWDKESIDTKTAIVDLVLHMKFQINGKSVHPAKLGTSRPMGYLPFLNQLHKRIKDYTRDREYSLALKEKATQSLGSKLGTDRSQGPLVKCNLPTSEDDQETFVCFPITEVQGG